MLRFLDALEVYLRATEKYKYDDNFIEATMKDEMKVFREKVISGEITNFDESVLIRVVERLIEV